AIASVLLLVLFLSRYVPRVRSVTHCGKNGKTTQRERTATESGAPPGALGTTGAPGGGPPVGPSRHPAAEGTPSASRHVRRNTRADCAHDRQILRHHGGSKTPAGAGRRRFRGTRRAGRARPFRRQLGR